MYQTVGHECIELVAQALELPLYRRDIAGRAVDQTSSYTPSPDDEVEDLHALLAAVLSHHPDVTAVSVGAILSDYQRVRVEHVCRRLGLTTLAFLWQRDQIALLAEMGRAGLEAVLIKVAAIGLSAAHVGVRLHDVVPLLLRLHAKYGVHPCGEGGEYESLVLDCPLFASRIDIVQASTIVHSADAFAPVAYQRVQEAVLVRKHGRDSLETAAQKSCRIRGIILAATEDARIRQCLLALDDEQPSVAISTESSKAIASQPMDKTCSVTDCDGFLRILLVGRRDDVSAGQALKSLFDDLRAVLGARGVGMDRVLAISLYLHDMKNFSSLNEVYSAVFQHNPPIRACVQLPLAAANPVMVEALVDAGFPTV